MPAWIIKYLGLKMIKALAIKAAKAFVKDYIVDEAIDFTEEAIIALSQKTEKYKGDDKFAADFTAHKGEIKAYVKERFLGWEFNVEIGTVLSLISLILTNVILVALMFTRLAREVTAVKTSVAHIHTWVQEINDDLKKHLIRD